MGFRFIHTADWQLGKPFAAVKGDAAALLREARFHAVRRIAAMANEHHVDAVLVAGDAFDANDVTDATLHKALQAMAVFTGAWVMLPGNHDAHLAECVWTRLRRLQPAANVLLAVQPDPIELCGGQAIVLPAPLTARHTYDDLTAWMDEADTPAGVIRVGLAHGSMAALLPTAADAANPIAPDRADRARLDYLALGDWHGTLEVAPRSWYAGTPEPDRYRTNEPGHALLVDIDAPGAPPQVRRLRTGRHRWNQLRLDFADDPEPAAMAERALMALGDPADQLVFVTLSGRIGLAGRAALDAMLQRWSAWLCDLRVDDEELFTGADDTDLVGADDGGVIGATARRLAARMASGSAEERAEAQLALRHLWSLLARLPAT